MTKKFSTMVGVGLGVVIATGCGSGDATPDGSELSGTPPTEDPQSGSSQSGSNADTTAGGEEDTTTAGPSSGTTGGDDDDGGSDDGGDDDDDAQPPLPSPTEATLFVAPQEKGGSDDNPGTEAEPLATPQAAIDRAVPGDVIWVRQGTYDGGIEFNEGGTRGEWIVLAGYPGELPIIDGGGGRALSVWNSAEHVIIERFEFRNMGDKGLGMHSNWTVVRDSIIRDAGTEAVSLKSQEYDEESGTRRHHNMVARCTIFGAGFSIFADTQTNTIISNNVFFDTSIVAIDPGGFRYGVIENNYFRYNEDMATGTRGPFKIRHGNNVDDCGFECSDDFGTIVRNNVVVGGAKYSLLLEDSNGVVVYNNDFVNNGDTWTERGLLYVADSAEGKAHRNNVVVNNIFSQNNLRVMEFNGMEAWADDQWFDYNLYYKAVGDDYIVFPGVGEFGAEDIGVGRAWTTASGYDSNSISGSSPQFVDPGTFDPPEHYALRDDSPAIDTGGPLTHALHAAESSTEVVVEDARFFTAGYGLIVGDRISIGESIAVRVVAVDYGTGTVTLANARSWEQGAPVSMAYEGAAVDIGAFEHGTEPDTVGDAVGRELAFP